MPDALPYYFAPGSSSLPASASICSLFVLLFPRGWFISRCIGLLVGLLPVGLLVGEVVAGLAAELLHAAQLVAAGLAYLACVFGVLRTFTAVNFKVV